MSIDKRVYDYLNKRYSDRIYFFIDVLAINPVIMYVILLIVNYLYFSNFYWRNIFLCGFACMALPFLKNLIKRDRPVVKKTSNLYELLSLQSDKYSFPSEHTFASFVLIPLTFQLSLPLGIFICIYSVFIGFSRIYSRHHYLSDVIAGAALGLGIGYLIAQI